MGKVITFYSFKGGVGRSMALANIAVMLARWGKSVLIVDWDLEAPGLEHFLVPKNSLDEYKQHVGLIDLLLVLAKRRHTHLERAVWEPFLQEISIKGEKNTISLITSGARGESYYRKVRELDVKSFYEDSSGGVTIEALRSSWKSNFDFILVDSRTGITDIGGICTIQLPDILAMVFTASEQSLSGVVDVAAKAFRKRQNLPFDRSIVHSLPIPSRFDTQTEHKIALKWLTRFEEILRPLYETWLPEDIAKREFLELTKVPYSSFFSFGESLAVIEQGTTDPSGLGYAYETIAALLSNHLHNADLLVEDRERFLRVAQSKYPLTRIPLRPVVWKYFLFVKLGSRGAENLRLQDKAQHEDVHAVVRKIIDRHAGDIAESDEEAVFVSFPDKFIALKCALEIQHRLGVQSPIIGQTGPFKVRIVLTSVETVPTGLNALNFVIKRVSAMTGMAKDGQILGSNFTVEDPNVDLRAKEPFVWLEKGQFRELPVFEIVPTKKIKLSPQEYAHLARQKPESRSAGGFQAFLVGLWERVDTAERSLVLTVYDQERIARYAHDYKAGGWQSRLVKIFGRSLGPDLGRSVTK